MTELATQPSARTFDLEELVDLVRRGRVRVPHFQREFRWESKDVLRLFDSIVHGYPIGSLLLWQRPASARRVRIGALSVDAPAYTEALWVVDGQQRITSLANALLDAGQGDARFSLSYDLKKKTFVSSLDRDLSDTIPLPVVFDLRRLLRWFTEHPDLADYVTDVNDLATKIRKFAVPAYVVDRADVRVLQDIFDRMNSYGKRLSRAEVFSALYAPDEDRVEETLTISSVADNVATETGFGSIDDDTVLRVILSRRGPDVTREIRIEFDEDRRSSQEFPNESRDQAFVAGQQALIRAVRFLQDDCGLPHLALLSYRYLLVVLARFFAHYPELTPRDRTLLRRWFWRAACLGPEIFKGSATGAMRALCNRVTPNSKNASLMGLLDAVGKPSTIPYPSVRRFRTNEAATRIVLSAYWAGRPHSLVTGERFTDEELQESLLDRVTAYDVATEIFSRRAVPVDKRTWASNRLLIPSRREDVTGLDQQILGVESRVEFATEGPSSTEILSSHFIDEPALTALRGGRIDTFLLRRDASMEAAVRNFVDRVCEWTYEDTPALDSFIFDHAPVDQVDEGPRDDTDA